MTDIGKLTYTLSLDTSRFSKQLKKFNKIASKRGRKTGKELGEELTKGARKELTHLDTVIGGFFQNIGMSMQQALASAFSSVGSAMSDTVSQAYSLEKSMKTIQGKSGATEKEISQLKDSFIKLSGSSTKTGDEIAKAGERMAMLGYNTKQTEGLMRSVVQVSEATGETMDTVTQSIGATINSFDQYNQTQEDAIEVGDKLTAVVNNANVTIDALRTGTSKYGAVANMTNQSVTDMAAAFGVLKDAGMSTEEAGTSLKTALMRLEPSSKKGKEAIKELGVEVRNAEGKMKSLPKILQEFQDGLEGMGEEKKAALLKQIFGAQGIKGFTTLLEAAGGKYEELRKTIEDSQGVAAETAKKMRTEWEKFTASVDALKHRVGAAVLPAFNAALKAINDIYKGIKKVGISFKPITKAVDALGLGFEYSEKAAKNLGKSIGNSINDAIEFTANLISRINEFWKENKSTIKGIGKFIENNVQDAVKNVVNFVSRLQNFWKQNKEELKEIWKQIGTKIKNAVVAVVSTVTDWITRIKEARDSFKNQKGLLDSIWKLIKSGYNAWSSVLDVLKFIGTYLKVVIENIGRFINFIAQVITGTNNAADAWSKIGDWLQKLIDWIADFINDTSDLVSLVAKNLTKAWKTLGDWLEKAAGWIDKQLDFSDDLIGKVGDGLAGAWESVTGWVDDLIGKLGDIWDWVTNLIGKIGSGLIDKIKQAKNALGGLKDLMGLTNTSNHC